MLKNCHKAIFFIVILAALLILPKQALALNVRVALSSGVSSAEFTVMQGNYLVRGGLSGSGELADLSYGDKLLVQKSGSGFKLTINGSVLGAYSGYVDLVPEDEDALNLVKYGGVTYRGSFDVLTSGYVVNDIDIDKYLYGVVGKEMSASFPAAALEAQAIASRSYVYGMIGSNVNYDVSATTASQVYGGYSSEQTAGMSSVIDAVDNTAGQVMYFCDEDGQKKVVVGYFHAHSGGWTENNENVWGGTPLPYLRGVESSYDLDAGPSSYNSWQVSYTPEQLSERLAKYMTNNNIDGSFGTLKELRLYYTDYSGSGATVSGRVTKAEAVGSGKTLTVYRDSIRSLLGLKSTLFTGDGSLVKSYDLPASMEIPDEVAVMDAGGNIVNRLWRELVVWSDGGENTILGDLSSASFISAAGTFSFNGTATSAVSAGKGENIVFNGSGCGHGIGMSQYGALGMAKAGFDVWSILEHYYGGDGSGKLLLETLD